MLFGAWVLWGHPGIGGIGDDYIGESGENVIDDIWRG